MERCAKHDLALSPGGDCILCRREARTPVPRWLVLLFAVPFVPILLFAAGRAAFRAITDDTRATPDPLATTVAAAAAPPPAVPAAPRIPTAAATTAFAAAPSDPQPPTAPAAPAATAPAAAPTVAALTDSDVRAQRSLVSITIYTTTWCGYCKAAKAWMNKEHLSFFERDIEHDPEAKQRMHVLNPRGGVPTINVDGQVLIGFDADELNRAIDASARRQGPVR